MERRFRPAQHPERSCRWMEDEPELWLRAICPPASQFVLALQHEAWALQADASPRAPPHWRQLEAPASRRRSLAPDWRLAALHRLPRGCLPDGPAILLRRPDL